MSSVLLLLCIVGSFSSLLTFKRQGKGDWRDEEMAFAHYERTVRMLNESMGICLR